MHLSLASFFLLTILHSSIMVESIDKYGIQNDVREFNLTCEENCEYYDLDNLVSKDCECGPQCARLGTCCLESHYINVAQPRFKPACRQVQNGNHYFIVDQCSSYDSVWASLCNDEEYDFQNGDDNIQKIVPVTSLFTSITYKNYYCLRCHESTNEFAYWTVLLESNAVKDSTYEDRSKRSLAEDEQIFFAYNKDLNTWMASYYENEGYFPVIITVTVPYQLDRLAHKCVQNVISDCSDKWSDEQAREKCQSYMALKEVRKANESTKIYRNIHCALCNFEDLSDVACRLIRVHAFGKVPFSFTYLLDINRSDGELVGKVQKCPEDNLWDPYTKKCRKLSCALPGYVLKSGKCVKE